MGSYDIQSDHRKHSNTMHSGPAYRRSPGPIRTSKGPLAWHAGQDAGLTTSLMFWKNGPSVKPQRRQSYLTCCSWGKTPDRRVTTPVSRTSWFRWNCLHTMRCIHVCA